MVGHVERSIADGRGVRWFQGWMGEGLSKEKTMKLIYKSVKQCEVLFLGV
jgi:hypothetical protein